MAEGLIVIASKFFKYLVNKFLITKIILLKLYIIFISIYFADH